MLGDKFLENLNNVGIIYLEIYIFGNWRFANIDSFTRDVVSSCKNWDGKRLINFFLFLYFFVY